MRRVVLAALLAVAGASNDYATPESHPHLEDMVSRVFAVDGATAANEAAMDDYFSSRSHIRSNTKLSLSLSLSLTHTHTHTHTHTLRTGECPA